eukprot:scaffold41815_cov287-Isochrysis_galbana.AAC.2
MPITAAERAAQKRAWSVANREKINERRRCLTTHTPTPPSPFLPVEGRHAPLLEEGRAERNRLDIRVPFLHQARKEKCGRPKGRRLRARCGVVTGTIYYH